MFSGGAHCSSNSVGYPLRVLTKGLRGSDGSTENNSHKNTKFISTYRLIALLPGSNLGKVQV